MQARSSRSFEQLAAIAAWVVGGCSLLYAIVYLGLVPSDQRSDDAAEFFSSYLNDGAAALHISWALISVSGIVSTLAIVALYRYLRTVDSAAGLWSSAVGVVGALLSAVHGIAEIAQNQKLADLWRDGDAATRAALAVTNSVPSATDPRGMATFGLAGLFWLSAGWLISRTAPGLPRNLGYLGIAGGVLLELLFAGSAFEIDPLVLIPGGLVSIVVGPAWWTWLGLSMWHAPSRS